MGLEVPWAETDEQKRRVAILFYSNEKKVQKAYHSNHRNPTMNTGDLARLKMKEATANDKYMIAGIRSFLDAGYIDIVDLEYGS